MSTSSDSPQTAAKPGTACLCCRRRKLRCSREQEGCSNCLRAELPCVYPAPDTNVKRKRGPYKKKDRPARQEHLEHVVKYLSTPVSDDTQKQQPIDQSLGENSERTLKDPGQTPPNDQHGFKERFVTCGSFPQNDVVPRRQPAASSTSEELVKDALIALTQTSVSEHEAYDAPLGQQSRIPATRTDDSGSMHGLHPPVRHVLELWHLFTLRVDPLTKIMHCPTFAPKLFAIVNSPAQGDSSSETLAFSIYYAAISSCSASEARVRFGESRDVLLHRYARLVEAAVANSYGIPEMESLQALLLYLTCVRRRESEADLWMLFSLSMRMAQLIGLDMEPGPDISPFMAEMRRRAWWTICGLEARCGEESLTKSSSVLQGRSVQLPANINDVDLIPAAKASPRSRAGITEMSFVLTRWEIVRLMFSLWCIYKERRDTTSKADEQCIRSRQRQAYDECNARLQSKYLDECDSSRPLDSLLLGLTEVMMLKARLSIDYPFGYTQSLTKPERLDLLQASVLIIRHTHTLHTHEHLGNWLWYFRDFVQWHSLAIVVAELGRSNNVHFSEAAWAVLDPILIIWDQLYDTNRHDPPWQYVNQLIEKAKQMRQQNVQNRPNTAQFPAQALHVSDHVSPSDQDLTSDELLASSYFGGSAMNSSSGPYLTISGQEPRLHTPQSGICSMAQPQDGSACVPPMDGLSDDFGSLGTPEIDFDALNAVFASPSWVLAGPFGDFDMDLG